MPGDVRLDVIQDQSRYISAALHEINRHLLLGSLLASLVVLLFMRSWRATVIASVAIPASVVSTFALMHALDFTLNSVTMLALVLMVGIVIDDAIVVLENIFRFVEEKKLAPFAAAKEATAEIALPVMATTMSLVVIFIPVAFMSSISGRFLYQFGFTAAAAILVSLLVSFTLTPMMSARMLRNGVAPGGQAEASVAARILRKDRAVLHGRCSTGRCGRRAVVVVVAVLISLAALPLYSVVKQEYTPSDVDEAEFEVRLMAPQGTSLAAMGEAIKAVEQEVRAMPGVRLVMSTVGGTFLGAVNEGELYVRIAPHDERVFSITPTVRGACPAATAGGVPRQLHAAGRDAGGSTEAAQISAIWMRRFATSSRSVSAGRAGTSISCFAVPICRSCRGSPTSLRSRAEQLGSGRRRDHAGARPAGAAGAHRPRACGRSRRRHRTDRRGAALDGRW